MIDEGRRSLCRHCGDEIALTRYGWGHLATRFRLVKHSASPVTRTALDLSPLGSSAAPVTGQPWSEAELREAFGK